MSYLIVDAQHFLGILNAKGAQIPNTPQMQYALLAWLNHENGAPTNPLGIEGSNGKFANFGSLSNAFDASASLLTTSSNYKGVISAGRTGDPTKFLTALAQSPWDGGFSSTSGHYGTVTAPYRNSLISLYNQYAGDTRQFSAISDPLMKYGTSTPTAGPGSGSSGGGGFDPFGIGAAANSLGGQIGDTFTWLGFILVGLVLVIGGIILMKPSAVSDAATVGKAAAL